MQMVIKQKQKIFYGWIVLGVLWAVYFLSTTPIAYGTGVVFTRMVLELGMDESVVGLATSAFFAANMLFGIPASLIAQKKGFHFALVLGSALVLAGCLVNSFVVMPVALYIVCFFIMGVGAILAGTVTGPGLVNAWFDRNKALPMSLLMTAGALGGFIMPVFSEYLADRSGWQSCWLVYGLLALISLVLAFVFIKNNPGQIGEVRDGRNWLKRKAGPDSSDSFKPSSEEGLTIWQALKHRQFPTLCMIQFGAQLLFGAGISYLVLYAVQNGISGMQAASTLAFMHVCGLLGRLAAGVRIKLPLYIQCGICSIGMCTGAVLLAFAGSLPGFFVAAGLIGFFYNLSYTLLTLMIPEYVGNKNYPLFFGTFSVVGSAGGTIAPILVAAIAGMSGQGYRISYLILGIIVAVCAVLAFVTPPKYHSN